MTTNSDDESKFQQVLDRLDKLTEDVEKSNEKADRFNDRFTNYQQATQWVVQLAFTLIASATITVIITLTTWEHTESPAQTDLSGAYH